jgi:hypothetical protein
VRAPINHIIQYALDNDNNVKDGLSEKVEKIYALYREILFLKDILSESSADRRKKELILFRQKIVEFKKLLAELKKDSRYELVSY